MAALRDTGACIAMSLALLAMRVSSDSTWRIVGRWAATLASIAATRLESASDCDGSTSRSLGGSSVVCWNITERAVSPTKGRLPVAMRKSITPSE